MTERQQTAATPYEMMVQKLKGVAMVRRIPGIVGFLVTFPDGVHLFLLPRGYATAGIATLQSRHRGRGYARAAMVCLLAISDEVGIRTILEAKPFGKGGLDKTALDGFYASLGYEAQVDKNGWHILSRPPMAGNCPPASAA